ncbi:MAG: hypothetical protein II934_07755, partial [Prevotella sp.]|nr:hypothetical protein [Prevotella sp.]
MKEITLLLLTLLSFQVANAQESAVPFLVEGKVWDYFDYYYIVKGDTTVNDVPCKKIYKNGDVYKAALYEEGK